MRDISNLLKKLEKHVYEKRREFVVISPVANSSYVWVTYQRNLSKMTQDDAELFCKTLNPKSFLIIKTNIPRAEGD